MKARRRWVQKTYQLTFSKICFKISRALIPILKPTFYCFLTIGLISGMTFKSSELAVEGQNKTSFEFVRTAAIYEVYPPITKIPERIDQIDLTNPQYFEWISLEAFSAALPATMRPYAQLYYKEGLHHEINFVFMAAKDSLESAYFTSPIFYQTNNAGGWTMQNGEFRTFDSPSEYISYSYDAIDSMYLTPGAAHFKGYTIDAINQAYNGKQAWTDEVSLIYKNYLIKILEY